MGIFVVYMDCDPRAASTASVMQLSFSDPLLRSLAHMASGFGSQGKVKKHTPRQKAGNGPESTLASVMLLLQTPAECEPQIAVKSAGWTVLSHLDGLLRVHVQV